MASDTQDTWIEDRSLEQKKQLLKWLRKVMRGTEDNTVKTECTNNQDNAHQSQLQPEEAESMKIQLNDDSFDDLEEFELLEEWREIRAKRKRRSTGNTDSPETLASCTNVNTEQNKKPRRTRKKPKLVVIEVGCGDSLHSLRVEAELMIRENPSGSAFLLHSNTSFASS